MPHFSTSLGSFPNSIYRNEDITAAMVADTEATMTGTDMEVIVDTVTAATVTTDIGVTVIAADTIIKCRILRQDQYQAAQAFVYCFLWLYP